MDIALTSMNEDNSLNKSRGSNQCFYKKILNFENISHKKHTKQVAFVNIATTNFSAAIEL